MDKKSVLTKLKILVIGESNVGKSSLLLRFTDNKFNESMKSTVGIDFKTKQMTFNDKIVTVTIWDTAGQERFRTLGPNYYRDAQGAILMFDVTDQHSFRNLETWLDELDIYSNKRDIVKMVVGNKIDLQNREVSTEEGLRFARRHQTLYIESSAKTADGVSCCFEELVQKIIQTPGLWSSMQPPKEGFIGNLRRRIGHGDVQSIKDQQSMDSSCYCSIL